MSFIGWMAFCGVLLLFMALSTVFLRNLPLSTSVIYLAIGIGIGPSWLNLVYVNVEESSEWLEPLTEVAVIISLFLGGLKLRLPLRAPAWSAALRMAGPLMLVCIVGVAAFSFWFLGLNVAQSLLLGAIMAPTDPVLATAVAVNNARDHDRLRFGLSGEAGLNDGLAFPFVMFALFWGTHGGMGDWITPWILHRLLWAVPAALLFGYLVGRSLGRLAVWLQSNHQDTSTPSDFLALAMIALSYVGAQWMETWGFLAAFTAGVGLRHAELAVVTDTPHPEITQNRSGDSIAGPHGEHPHPPAEQLVDLKKGPRYLREPAVAAGVLVSEVLSFGDSTERLLEVFLVMLVGVALYVHWDARAIPLAIALMLIIRPLGARLTLLKTPTTSIQRWLMGWFGIRGIGSLYYLTYAMNNGLSSADVTDVCNLTLSTVAISIIVHGITTQPFLARYARILGRQG